MSALLQQKALEPDQLETRLPEYVPTAIKSSLTHTYEVHTMPKAQNYCDGKDDDDLNDDSDGDLCDDSDGDLCDDSDDDLSDDSDDDLSDNDLSDNSDDSDDDIA